MDKLKKDNLEKIIGCIDIHLGNQKITEEFEKIKVRFKKHDPVFLWTLSLNHPRSGEVLRYLDENYKKFHQQLDSKFLGKLLQKGRFISHLWEMVLFDSLSLQGDLVPKSESGADIMLKTKDDQIIYIEAIAPDEADDLELRAVRPDYSESNFFTIGGSIDDLENPIVLRALYAFDDKAKKEDIHQAPLIIAINTSKVVGTVSHDPNVIRRFLLGLANHTITKLPDGSYINGLEQKPKLKKPRKPDFPAARFRDPKYKHISGVIYSSQNPLELIPGGSGWSNYGITYIPNPLATHKVDVDFNCFRKIICNEEVYQEIEATRDFNSSVSGFSSS